MDQYMASLARACLTASGIGTLYTDNVPENFAVPSLYFPPYETGSSGSALNSYATDYTIYAKVFANTKSAAEEMADKIVQGIMMAKGRIPVYKEDGSKSGDILKIASPDSRGVDECMAQVTLRYKIITGYTETKYPSANNVGINKNFD